MTFVLILAAFALTGAAKRGDETIARARDKWDGWRN